MNTAVSIFKLVQCNSWSKTYDFFKLLRFKKSTETIKFHDMKKFQDHNLWAQNWNGEIQSVYISRRSLQATRKTFPFSVTFIETKSSRDLSKKASWKVYYLCQP